MKQTFLQTYDFYGVEKKKSLSSLSGRKRERYADETEKTERHGF